MKHISPTDAPEDFCGTTYAAKLLGLSVGTIQALVEKNELQAWKTQGGQPCLFPIAVTGCAWSIPNRDRK